MNFAKLSNDELQELLAARTQHARAIDATVMRKSREWKLSTESWFGFIGCHRSIQKRR
jgi:hypothetical protein